ncbi:3D domain-containing protein [Enhygromyxa salina]|uniref:3D domain protein n=1 Tax=Enhygromyxa salina TaxID=215803 RepID=A0A2S9XT91_9BACT|nr:3D domain-containing protein [Enhygromyxa salina]PRP96087.1 3D domain protein [Enhygromyxa salina]
MRPVRLAPLVLSIPLACATANGDTEADTASSQTTADTSTRTAPPAGDPGASIGVFDLTYYWVSHEADFDPPASTTIGTCAGQRIATVPAGFARALKLEGSGKLLDDRVVNIGGCGCGDGYDCFAVLDPARFVWGQGSRGNALVPYLSIATDTSVLPFGTSVYAPGLDGVALPDGRTHDGCLRAADVGGGIEGTHVDWFVGLKGNYRQLDANVPERVELLEGGTRCP